MLLTLYQFFRPAAGGRGGTQWKNQSTWGGQKKNVWHHLHCPL